MTKRPNENENENENKINNKKHKNKPKRLSLRPVIIMRERQIVTRACYRWIDHKKFDGKNKKTKNDPNNRFTEE